MDRVTEAAQRANPLIRSDADERRNVGADKQDLHDQVAHNVRHQRNAAFSFTAFFCRSFRICFRQPRMYTALTVAAVRSPWFFR